MKKIGKLSVLLFCIFMVLSTFNFVKADSSLKLKNLNFDVKINSDGSMDVTEIWDINISDTNTLFKTFKIDTNKYTSISNEKVSKITQTGEEIAFKDANMYYYHVPTNQYYFLKRGNEYEVAWGTGYENSSGTEKYKISYHIEGAIGIYEDCSELYWQFLGSDFEIPAKKITGKIKLPKEVENIEDLRVWGHTPDLNGTIDKISNDTVEFNVNNHVSNKMLEVRIAMPKDTILNSTRTYSTSKLDRIIKAETEWAQEANDTRMRKILVITVICVVIFGLLIYFLVRNILIMRKTKRVLPTVHHDYYRELPREDATPTEATYILKNNYNGLDNNDIGKIFSATLLNLSLKKAIRIEEITNENGSKDERIEIICDNIIDITNKKDEILVFDFIKGACAKKRKNKDGIYQNDSSITMKDLKKYIQSYSSKVVSLKASIDSYIKSNLISKNILDTEGIKKRGTLFLSGCLSTFVTFFIFFFVANIGIITSTIESIGIPYFVIIAMIALIIIDVVTENVARNKISVYTQQGIDEQDKWKAFKKYMEDFSLLKEKELPDLALWEKYLVYATAFGISEKVIKQLKVAYPNYNELDYALYPNMYLYTHTNFNNSFNTISNSMSSSFSSGTGGGGGFSGGGGRRWRPVAAVAGR